MQYPDSETEDCMKRILNSIVLAAALGSIPAITAMPAIAADHRAASDHHKGTTSYDYAFGTFRERVNGISVLVDAYPATLHEADAYIPIPIAIGVRTGGPTIKLTTESFQLIDATGKSVAPASYEEIARDYSKRTFDASLFAERPIVLGNLFDTSIQVASRFFPPPGGATRTDRVELSGNTWFQDVLYFPKPANGMKGLMTLRVEGQGMAPMEVKFKVPRDKSVTD
jgi:hypothetical protein